MERAELSGSFQHIITEMNEEHLLFESEEGVRVQPQ